MVNSIRVVSIEPVDNYRRLVTMRDADGDEYTMVYGDSVSEEVIRNHAPSICNLKLRGKR